MDTESLKISAEVYWIRFRALIVLLLRLAGVAAVILGAFNLFAVATPEYAAVRPYPTVQMVASQDGIFYLGDVLVIAGGAVVAWFL